MGIFSTLGYGQKTLRSSGASLTFLGMKIIRSILYSARRSSFVRTQSGIPRELRFYSAHAAKDPPKTRDCLFDLFNETDSTRKEILYDGHWFTSGKELRTYDPSLRCMA